MDYVRGYNDGRREMKAEMKPIVGRLDTLLAEGVASIERSAAALTILLGAAILCLLAVILGAVMRLAWLTVPSAVATALLLVLALVVVHKDISGKLR